MRGTVVFTVARGLPEAKTLERLLRVPAPMKGDTLMFASLRTSVWCFVVVVILHIQCNLCLREQGCHIVRVYSFRLPEP